MWEFFRELPWIVLLICGWESADVEGQLLLYLIFDCMGVDAPILALFKCQLYSSIGDLIQVSAIILYSLYSKRIQSRISCNTQLSYIVDFFIMRQFLSLSLTLSLWYFWILQSSHFVECPSNCFMWCFLMTRPRQYCLAEITPKWCSFSLIASYWVIYDIDLSHYWWF